MKTIEMKLGIIRCGMVAAAAFFAVASAACAAPTEDDRAPAPPPPEQELSSASPALPNDAQIERALGDEESAWAKAREGSERSSFVARGGGDDPHAFDEAMPENPLHERPGQTKCQDGFATCDCGACAYTASSCDAVCNGDS